MMKIALLGIQGSGKSTQAEALGEALGIEVVSVGGILRAGIEADDPFVTSYYPRKDLDAGLLAPEELIRAVVEREVLSHSDIIIEGFPRTEAQAQFMLEHCPVDHVLEVTLSEECAYERLTARGRSDDTKAAIHNRFSAYYQQIQPIRTVFTEQGWYRDVDGDLSIEEVTQSLLSVVQKK